MLAHPLDMPAAGALKTRHQRFAQVEAGAMRYDPGIVPFSVVDPDDPMALGRLVKTGEVAVFLQAATVQTPPGFKAELRADVVQMTADPQPFGAEDSRIIELTANDAPAMLALATETRPGPFTLRARDLGTFWGIKENGKLVAMVGERMSLPGWSEVSGVCAAPEARGKGYARLLSLKVMGEIANRGDQAFLHAWTTNEAAIGLYQSIGFTTRAELPVAMMRRVED